MEFQDRLQNDLKHAMRAQDEVRKRTLRLALAAINYKQVELGRELSDADVVAVLSKEARQRRETLEELAGANRPDLVAAEQAELAVLEAYLPGQLSRDEIAGRARQVIAELGATGPRQMGQVMSVLMPQLQGQADGKLVNQVVRELLSQ